MATAAQIKKALAASSKSDGMRQLFDTGMGAAEVASTFGVPYGFAYGVGKRNGSITPEPRAAKAPAAKAKSTTKSAGATRAAAAKAAPKSAAKSTRRTKTAAK